MMRFLFLIVCCLFTSCLPKSQGKEMNRIEAKLQLPVHRSHLESLPSPFLPLSDEELQLEFAKELRFALYFSKQLDFYRAITCFQRALATVPEASFRKGQIEYGIVHCYFLAKKYEAATSFFEQSSLTQADLYFPAFADLLTLLYDSYRRQGKLEKALKIQQIIQSFDQGLSDKLKIGTFLLEGDLESLQAEIESSNDLEFSPLVAQYQRNCKSIRRAKTYNALLPGAGYWYVGQKKTAVTALLLNSLFIAAAYRFFDRGHTAAGIFTTSAEMGWYFGGIQGAGLAAEEYNRYLYEDLAGKALREKKLYPQLLLRFGF